jgi:hypothetical protein
MRTHEFASRAADDRKRLFKNGDAPGAILAQLRALSCGSFHTGSVTNSLSTVGYLQRPEKSLALAQVLARNLNDRWFQKRRAKLHCYWRWGLVQPPGRGRPFPK